MTCPEPIPEGYFARALRGEPCTVHGLGARPMHLPVADWQRTVDAADRAMLGHCTGATLDIGCGPGRMTTALAERGQASLGIDLVPEAVDQTIRRGGVALLRDVHTRLPAEGRWQSALLADGNIGIGGDPVRLLRRVAEVLASAGRVVVEVADPGVPQRVVDLCLVVDGERSASFPWAVVGADDIAAVAAEAGLLLRSLHQHDLRWCSVLEKP